MLFIAGDNAEEELLTLVKIIWFTEHTDRIFAEKL